MARGRGRGRGRGAARGRKAVRVISSDEEQPVEQETSPESTLTTNKEEKMEIGVAGQSSEIMSDAISSENKMDVSVGEINDENTCVKIEGDSDENRRNDSESSEIKAPTIDMEADISQLEAPTFTTISRGPPEPMLHLDWNHKVNLIGEKVINPMIHCCDQCEKPILIYGRMIPCKHVFCLGCARKETMKMCPRCKEKAIRVEQTGLGTVFMCTHGGTRYESKGCRRTYLSQRDLQAHINHRHINTPMIPRLESLAVKLDAASTESSTIATTTTSNSLLSPQKKQDTRPNRPITSSPNAGQYTSHHLTTQRATQGQQQYFSTFSGYSVNFTFIFD